MARIIIDHPSIETTQSTTLTSAVLAAGTSLPVQNTTGYTANDYVVVGVIGDEVTEIKKIGTITYMTTLLCDALSFPHGVDTLISKIDYNQVKIYSSATETGTYSLVATVDITVDNPIGTRYDDPAGTATTWYKVAYYNSTSAATSDYSDPYQAGVGVPDYSLRGMQDRMISLIDDDREEQVVRDEITIWLNEGYQKAQNRLRRKDEKYGMTSAIASFVNGTAEYSLPTDCYQLYRIDTDMDGSGYRTSTYLDLRDDDPRAQDYYSPIQSRFYLFGTKIGFKPTPSTGSYKLWYYQQPFTLSSDGDQLDDPFKSYSDMIIDFALSRYFTKEYDSDRRSAHFNQWQAGIKDFLDDITSRQIQSPSFIAIKDQAYNMGMSEEVYKI